MVAQVPAQENSSPDFWCDVMELTCKNLTKKFGELTAVDSLSFTMDHGEIWGFIGPNGAGKTTTLRMLATVAEPTRGDAYVNGYSIRKQADKVRPLIGFMPDYYGSYPDLLVSEYLDFFARAYGLSGRKRFRRVADIVDFTEIDHLLDKKVADLSKGMRQRISLGRTLLHGPQLLLLDEPAAGLDPQARKDLRELLRVLAQRDKTIMISSHILAELEGLVDKVAIIKEGELVYSGSPADHEAKEGDFTLTMRVTGGLEECGRILLETPGVRDVHSTEPDILQVEMSGGKDDIAEVVKRLVSHEKVPYQLMTEEKLLEKMFLEVTSGDTDVPEA